MKPESARALTWFAAILALVGCLVPSPGGACIVFFVAAAAAAFPAFFGAGKIRLVAAALLLLSIGLTIWKYPDFKSEQKRYREHSKTSPADKR